MPEQEIKIQSAKPNKDLLSVHPEVRPGPGAKMWLAIALVAAVVVVAMTLSNNPQLSRVPGNHFPLLPIGNTTAQIR